MALRKDGNSRSSASYKPYDPSNSFVKKMTNTVTGLFNWRSLQSESQHFNDVLNSNSDDDRIAPAAKRMKVQNDDKVQFQSISNTGRGLQDTCSPIKPINDIHAAGPSNRNKCIISSTPATTFQRSPVFFNTIDQSSNKRVTQNAEDSEAADISTSLPQFSVHQRHNITVPSLPKDVPNMMSTIDASKSLSGSFSSTNSRRPSFNVDVFSASSRRLSLSVCEGRNRNCLSPFYSARTMYGGASALLPYGSQTASRMRSASTSKLDVFSPRSQITMQPVPSPSKLNDQEILSASARRILDSLEKYCSPVSDAKRIPMSESNRKSAENSSPQHSLSRGVKRKLPTLNQMLPSTSELLRIKRTERMQDSVSSAKQTVSAVPESSIAAEDSDSSSDSAELDYSVLSQESKDSAARSGGKVTRKNESKFDDRPKAVNLPNAVLKISNLPKFDVTDEFVFSKPLLLENLDDKVDESSSDTAVAKNNKSTQSPAASTAPLASPSTSGSFSKGANKSNVTQTFTAAFLKTAKPALKLSPTPKSTDDQSPSRFSLSNDTACPPKGSSRDSPKASWTCMNCLTKNSADECSKCSRQRQQKAEPVAPAKVVEEEKSEEPKAPSWGDKFKPPADTWECPECLVRNKNACVECAACGKAKNNVAKSGATASSGGFDWQNLKKPTGWSCGTCCVQNKETDTKCAACEQPKEPSKGEATASKEPPKPQFSFGIDKSGVAPTSGAAKFGAPDKPAGSITFGTPSVSTAASAAAFTFGVKSSQPATTSATTNGETTPVTTAAAVPTFTFGLPKSTAPETNANVSPAAKNPLLSTPVFGSFGEKSADKKDSPSVVNDVSGVTKTNPLLANDSSIFKTPKFAAPKPVAVSPKENGEEGGHNPAANLFNDAGSELPKKKMALFSSVLKGEPSNGLATKNPATVSNGGPNVSHSGNTFVTSLATSAFTPAPAKLTNDTQLSFGAAATATPKTDGPIFGDKGGMKMFGSQTNSFGSMATTSAATTTPLLFGNSMMSTNAFGGTNTSAVKSTDTPQLASVGGGAAAPTFPAAMPPAFAFGANSSAAAAAPTSLKSSEMSLSENPAATNFTSAAAAQPPVFSFGGNAVSAAPAAAATIPASGAFMFNGPKADDGAASKFRFGATNPTPFGNAAAAGATAVAPSFTFGSTPSGLNAVHTDQNERPAANALFGNAATLNRAPETPAVNANSISGFGGANVFGNAAASQPANPAKKSGGFSFNAQSPFTAPAVNNFPSFASPAVNQEPKPAASTFVFGGNNQTPQTHNFNQTVPSTFNFSGGNTQVMSFSAPPVPPSAAPNACGPTRKIKKAVRRTTPK